MKRKSYQGRGDDSDEEDLMNLSCVSTNSWRSHIRDPPEPVYYKGVCIPLLPPPEILETLSPLPPNRDQSNATRSFTTITLSPSKAVVEQEINHETHPGGVYIPIPFEQYCKQDWEYGIAVAEGRLDALRKAKLEAYNKELAKITTTGERFQTFKFGMRKQLFKIPSRLTKHKFCPRCANLLTLNDSTGNQTFRMQCPSCPFFIPVTRKIVFSAAKPKEEEDAPDIIEASQTEEHRQRTQVVCPDCSHTEAFFHQMQTRSADEPMTNFYECTNEDCKKNWRD